MAELQEYLHQLDKPGVADKVDQLAVQLITEIILHHIEESTSDKNTVEMRIYSTANDLVNGKELARAVHDNGFSTRSFYREWKRHFDLSPKTYVLYKKLEKAKQLLSESNLNNIEIARQCGFENVKYFYSWFRKNFNLSPREYKQKVQQEQQIAKL
jgi:AraC-like DNA-binding protein